MLLFVLDITMYMSYELCCMVLMQACLEFSLNTYLHLVRAQPLKYPHHDPPGDFPFSAINMKTKSS
jgi:hypothetical protein